VIGAGFNKIFVFCDKFCVKNGKCVFIIIKTKCVNSGKISDIYNKLNFITNYTHCTIREIYFIKIHTYITIFDKSDGRTVP
jgi:hypothetical protein